MRKVILAGGGGTRLWPLSTEHTPKQFIPIFSDRSLLQETFARMQAIDGSTDTIYFSSNQKYGEQILGQIACPPTSLILEPSRKNTAPAIALIVKYLEEIAHCAGDEIILIVPSDHIISPIDTYAQYITSAFSEAQNGHMIVFGIAPTKPETGYGYIRKATTNSPTSGILCPVENFVEKPDVVTAQKYLDAGDYLWNAGMFMFSLQTIKDAFARYCPDLFDRMQVPYAEFVASFDTLDSISLDYAVMEKASDVFVCPMDITWSDVGSWDAIDELLRGGHVMNTNSALVVDEHNNLIVSKKPVIADGIQDSFIIEGEDGLYIAKKGNSQALRKN